MSTAIVRHDATVSSLADVRAVAEQFAISNYFDAKGNNPQAIAQVLTKIMAGRELGYGPFIWQSANYLKEESFSGKDEGDTPGEEQSEKTHPKRSKK